MLDKVLGLAYGREKMGGIMTYPTVGHVAVFEEEAREIKVKILELSHYFLLHEDKDLKAIAEALLFSCQSIRRHTERKVPKITLLSWPGVCVGTSPAHYAMP